MKGITEKDLNDYLTIRDQRVNNRFLADRVFRGTVTGVTPGNNASISTPFLVTVQRNGDTVPDLTRYACAIPQYVPQIGDVVDLFWRSKNEAIVLQCITPKIFSWVSTGGNSWTWNVPPAGPGVHLFITLQLRGNAAALAVEGGIQLNGDSASNYSYRRSAFQAAYADQDSGVTTQTSMRNWFFAGANTVGGGTGIVRIWIPNYGQAGFNKMARIEWSYFTAATWPVAAQLENDITVGFWAGTSAISSISFIALTGGFTLNSSATMVIGV